jgi:hypothetical protein
MIDARVLDVAFQQGAYRIGSFNLRPVKCALCGADCLPTQARRVHLTAQAWRGVFLCLATCLPKEARQR